MSEPEAAEQEAWQEGGVRGTIELEPFATYTHQKREWKTAAGKEFLIAAFLLDVTSEEAPQERNRSPRWFSLEEAAERLAEGRSPRYAKEFSRVLARAARRLDLPEPNLGTVSPPESGD